MNRKSYLRILSAPVLDLGNSRERTGVVRRCEQPWAAPPHARRPRSARVLPGAVLLCATILVVRGVTFAQNTTLIHPHSSDVDSVNGISAQELVQRALIQNGELLAARQQIEAARGALVQARLRPNPMIEVSGLQQFSGSDDSIVLGGSLPLELFGRRGRRVEVADRALELARHEVADRERQLAAQVRAKFGDILSAERNLRFTEDLLNLNRDSFRLISARVEKGATAPLEENMERVEVSRIEAMRTEFEGRVQVGLLELRNLVGMQPDEPLVLKDELEAWPVRLTRAEAVKKALAERSDARAARASEALAEARLRQAQTEGSPDASLFANYQRMDLGFDVNGFAMGGGVRRVQGIFHYFTVGLSISLPVRNRNQGAIQSASADLEAAHRRHDYSDLVIAREVAAAYVRYEKTREGREIYARGVRKQAESNLRVIRQTYDFGRTTLLDVIAEQRRYIEVETGYSEVLNQHYQALVELERAVGGSVK